MSTPSIEDVLAEARAARRAEKIDFLTWLTRQWDMALAALVIAGFAVVVTVYAL
jgi:hypothetical protein